MSDNVERTLAIIKPDAFTKGYAGKILDAIVEANFSIIGMKLLKLSKEEAGQFYDIHKGKYFYDRLCEFMSSDKIIVIALEHENAIHKWRELMGATDPNEADEGTLRQRFGVKITYNATHGSDCIESGKKEVSFFFKEFELYK